ncbi:MAG: phosphodiester glycosidase family protein [Synergistetes bacterium]|nr:phosphodiester glycosidase family protein [Synergistota bacterium]
MKRPVKLTLIITLFVLLNLITTPIHSKPIPWNKFVRELSVISNLHTNLALTKSALKDFKNNPITRAEALLLTIEALGLSFEANLLQEVDLNELDELHPSLRGAVNLSILMKPPLIGPTKVPSIKWLKGNLDEKEAKSLIERALHLKNTGGKVSFKKKIDKDLELYWERSLNPNLYISYLKFNPQSDSLKLGIELAGSQVQNKERLSDICRRMNAIAGINGGFFKSDGEPVGALMIDGVLISEPLPNRGCFGWSNKGKFIFGKVSWEGSIRSQNGLTITIDGLNRKPNKDEELIVYTPFYGEILDLGKESTIATIRGERVYEVKRSQIEVIPKDGFIIVGYGERGNILYQLQIGEKVSVKAYLIPEKKSPIWREVSFLIQGGPTLIENGEIVNDDEGFNHNLINKKHPRTIIGETRSGHIILMVIDGRNPIRSEGLTVEELKIMLKNLGLKNALNLDGGGSTTLYLQGKLYNTPSDGKEREISYALLILNKKKGEKL